MVFPIREPSGPDFISLEQAVGLSDLVKVAHGLGGPPAHVLLSVKCKVAEGGYTPGDEEFTPYLVGIASDETNVIIIQPPLFQIYSHTLFSPIQATQASWRWIVRAWRY